MKVLIVGCGYVGQRAAERWQAAGAEVHVVTRSASRAAMFQTQGYQPLVANILDPQSLPALPTVDTVLFAVGYDRNSSMPIEEVYAPGLANVLAKLPSATGRVLYISSTGVYGPSGGGWVDEATAPQPQRAGGRASLAAEQVLATHPLGARSVILRLAGIYGPGRIPYLAKLRAGEPLAVPSAGWLNLIHVADAARVALAASDWGTDQLADGGPEVFCVCDGHPVIRADYYRRVAELVGAPAPQFVPPADDSPAAQRARSEKRIRNRKLVESLDFAWQYPSYQQGLAAILSAESC